MIYPRIVSPSAFDAEPEGEIVLTPAGAINLARHPRNWAKRVLWGVKPHIDNLIHRSIRAHVRCYIRERRIDWLRLNATAVKKNTKCYPHAR
jgi:hypothetical protein